MPVRIAHGGGECGQPTKCRSITHGCDRRVGPNGPKRVCAATSSSALRRPHWSPSILESANPGRRHMLRRRHRAKTVTRSVTLTATRESPPATGRRARPDVRPANNTACPTWRWPSADSTGARPLHEPAVALTTNSGVDADTEAIIVASIGEIDARRSPITDQPSPIRGRRVRAIGMRRHSPLRRRRAHEMEPAMPTSRRLDLLGALHIGAKLGLAMPAPRALRPLLRPPRPPGRAVDAVTDGR